MKCKEDNEAGKVDTHCVPSEEKEGEDADEADAVTRARKDNTDRIACVIEF